MSTASGDEMTIAERRKKVKQMYTNGLAINSIAELLGMSVQSVRSDLAIMGVSDLPIRYAKKFVEAMTVDDVREFINNHPDGSTSHVMGGITIVKGYPHIVITNKGTFSWTDLAVRAWRKSKGLSEEGSEE